MPGGSIAQEYDPEDEDADARKKSERYYPWGYCRMNLSTEYRARVECYDELSNMMYRVYFKRYPVIRRMCIVRNTVDVSDYRSKICANETQNTPQTDTDYNYIYYSYP